MRPAGCINYPDKKKRERGYVTELVTVQVARQPHESTAKQLLALRPVEQTGENGHDHDAWRQSDRSDDELFTLLKDSRVAGHRHNSMRAAIASMVGRGWSDDAIRTVCGRYCNNGRSDQDLDPLITGARIKWDKPDTKTGTGG